MAIPGNAGRTVSDLRTSVPERGQIKRDGLNDYSQAANAENVAGRSSAGRRVFARVQMELMLFVATRPSRAGRECARRRKCSARPRRCRLCLRSAAWRISRRVCAVSGPLLRAWVRRRSSARKPSGARGSARASGGHSAHPRPHGA